MFSLEQLQELLKKHTVTKPEGKKPVQKVEDIEKEFKALKKFLSGEECVHTEGVSYVWTNIGFVVVYCFEMCAIMVPRSFSNG